MFNLRSLDFFKNWVLNTRALIILVFAFTLYYCLSMIIEAYKLDSIEIWNRNFGKIEQQLESSQSTIDNLNKKIEIQKNLADIAEHVLINKEKKLEQEVVKVRTVLKQHNVYIKNLENDKQEEEVSRQQVESLWFVYHHAKGVTP